MFSFVVFLLYDHAFGFLRGTVPQTVFEPGTQFQADYPISPGIVNKLREEYESKITPTNPPKREGESPKMRLNAGDSWTSTTTPSPDESPVLPRKVTNNVKSAVEQCEKEVPYFCVKFLCPAVCAKEGCAATACETKKLCELEPLTSLKPSDYTENMEKATKEIFGITGLNWTKGINGRWTNSTEDVKGDAGDKDVSAAPTNSNNTNTPEERGAKKLLLPQMWDQVMACIAEEREKLSHGNSSGRREFPWQVISTEKVIKKLGIDFTQEPLNQTEVDYKNRVAEYTGNLTRISE